MATDHYGQTINVGDRVTKVGTCDVFVVTEINSSWGEELMSLSGPNWDEDRVHSGDVIKQ